MPFVTGLEKMLMEKGRKMGRTEGERAGLRASLELVLELKFKKAGKVFLAELKAITDVAKLRAFLQAIRDGATIAKLKEML
jgi:hypothetical protein